MSNTKERKALLGILPKCGHACAFGVNPEMARKEFAASGYDMLTLPYHEALRRVDREWDEHLLKCEKGGDR